jgi:hypothetical protein
MKSRPIGVQNILATDHNTRRDDARGGSLLLAHQQLGALALGTAPTNGQTVTVIVNGTSIVFNAVTGSPTNPGDVKAPGSALGFVTNLIAALRRPDLATSTYVPISAPNQQLIQYLGWAWPGSSTSIVPFSFNKNVNGAVPSLTSFNITTTVTSGTWTAQTMQLYIEDGTYYIGTTRVLFLGSSTPTFTAPVSNPRIDIVTADSSGTIAVVTGTENVSPVAPAYPANKIVLAEVYHVVGETTIYDNENQQAGQGYILNDVRTFLAQAGYIASLTQVASGLFIADPGSEAQGDILYYNGSAWVRLPASTSGFFLKTNGASANPAWAQPSTQLFSTATEVDVGSGTTTEQTMISFTLPANTLGTTGVIKGKLQFSQFPLNITGTTNKVVRFYFGSTAVATSTIFQPTSNSNGQAVIEWEIIANGATNSQMLTLRVIVNTNGAISTASTNIEMVNGSAAIDSTSSQTIKVTTQDSGSTGFTQKMVAAYAFS